MKRRVVESAQRLKQGATTKLCWLKDTTGLSYHVVRDLKESHAELAKHLSHR
jgi:hypothetical protein